MGFLEAHPHLGVMLIKVSDHADIQAPEDSNNLVFYWYEPDGQLYAKDSTDSVKQITNDESGNRLLYLESGGRVASATTPATIFDTPWAGSRDLPANWWTTSRVVLFEFTGDFTGDTTPPTFTISLGFEGEATVDFPITLPSADFSGTFKFRGRLWVSNPGATATFAGDAELYLTDSSSGNTSLVLFPFQAAGSTVDTTAALTLDALIGIDAGSPNEWGVGDYFPAVIKLEEVP